jgi:hypothetical protein
MSATGYSSLKGCFRQTRVPGGGAITSCRPCRRLQRESAEATLIEYPAPLAGCMLHFDELSPSDKLSTASRSRSGLRGGIVWDGSPVFAGLRYDVSLRSTSTQPAKTRETRPLLGKSLPMDPGQSSLPVRCTPRTCACHICQSQLVSTPAPAVSNPRSAPHNSLVRPSWEANGGSRRA